MYRTVCCEFWTDPKVRTLSVHGKLTFLYLMTNPHSHLSGLYYLTRDMMRSETSIGRGIDGALSELQSNQLAIFLDAYQQIWVVNMFRYQGKGQKTDSGVARHLTTLHSSPLITRFIEKYPQVARYLPEGFIRCPIDAPSTPHTDFASPVPSSDSSLLTNPDQDLKSKNHANKNAASHDFEQFWQQYPRKIGKKAALAAWGRADDRPALAEILLAVDHAKRSEQWTKDGGQFIPHPATWLNQGRWADVVEASPKGGTRPPPPPPKNDPIGRGLWSRTYGNPKEHGYE